MERSQHTLKEHGIAENSTLVRCVGKSLHLKFLSGARARIFQNHSLHGDTEHRTIIRTPMGQKKVSTLVRYLLISGVIFHATWGKKSVLTTILRGGSWWTCTVHAVVQYIEPLIKDTTSQ